MTSHPRLATVHHRGAPDYALVRELAERLEVPVIVSGGAPGGAERPTSSPAPTR